MTKVFSVTRRVQAFLLAALILATTVAVYAPVSEYPFIDFDDPLYVLENPKVRSGLSIDTLRWSFTGAVESSNYWAPLTWISFLVDFELSGLDPGGYHRTNLLLHAANGLLLFFLLLKTTGCLWRSWLVALLFAVHPLHVESVAWVSERKDVLSTLFALLTLLAYSRYVRKPSVSAQIPVWMLFAMGIMAKPMLVTLPFVLLLFDYWPLGRYPSAESGGLDRRKAPAAFGRMVVEKLPLFAVSLLASLAAYMIQASEGAVASAEAIPWTLRAAVAATNYMGYLVKAAWPVDLSIIYLYPARVPPATVAAASVALLFLTALSVRLAASRPYLPVGWFWYLGTLFPVVGLVVIGPHAMADRYTYIPLIGVFIAAVWGAADVARRRPVLQKVLVSGAIAAVAALSLAAAGQVTYWRSTEALFSHAAAVTEDNWFALNVVGRQHEKAGRINEALAAYRRSLRIHPGIAETHYLFGSLLGKTGKNADAEHHYRKALRLKPKFPTAHNNLGNLLASEGRRGEAVEHYREAIRIHPGYARARYNLAVALEAEGRKKEAAGQYLEVIRLDPHFAGAYVNLGVLMYRSGDAAGAEKMFKAALRADPQSELARQNLNAVQRRR